MLELQSLTKDFRTLRAVDSVPLSIPDGQMVGVIGRSGAGKSTLLRMLNRLVDPTAGRILFGGREIDRLSGRALHAWRAECAMVFQQFNLVPRLDVLTNVMLGRLNRLGTARSVFKLFSDSDRRTALQALDWLGIAETAMQQAGTLSGGQQQRVAIARALVQEPKIILADEPIASLDPMNAQLVMDALKRINETENITVICNLHTLDTARNYCERIVGMREGRVVFDGTSETLTTQAAREIYGAGQDFNEASTSTQVEAPAPVPTVVEQPAVGTMVAS